MSYVFNKEIHIQISFPLIIELRKKKRKKKKKKKQCNLSTHSNLKELIGETVGYA